MVDTRVLLEKPSKGTSNGIRREKAVNDERRADRPGATVRGGVDGPATVKEKNEWRSSELARNRPAKGLPIGSPAPCGSILSTRHPIRHASRVPVSRSSRGRALHGTPIPSVKP